MLFDTLRRKNQAEQEEREWNANRPADYVSRNKDAMDSLTGQIGSGFDWDTGSKAYQQYRAQAQANAAASAENAQANAAMLAGGYGSSYADSVAKQGQQQALSGIDNAVPGLRGQALSEYQNQQNDLLSALSGMASAGMLPDGDTGTTAATGTGSGLIAPLANPNKWALPGGTTGGSTGKSTGMPYSNALSYAKGWSAEGVDSDTIYARLVNMGINDDVAAKVWNAMGW